MRKVKWRKMDDCCLCFVRVRRRKGKAKSLGRRHNQIRFVSTDLLADIGSID